MSDRVEVEIHLHEAELLLAAAKRALNDKDRLVLLGTLASEVVAAIRKLALREVTR